MDILYYSNYCKHSQKIIQFLVKNQLNDKLNFICIDKRRRDPKTGQTQIVLENGNMIVLPPNIQSVPALLLVKQNYNVILGDNIIAKYQTTVETNQEVATHGQGEPMGVSLASVATGLVHIVFSFVCISLRFFLHKALCLAFDLYKILCYAYIALFAIQRISVKSLNKGKEKPRLNGVNLVLLSKEQLSAL
jgi:hypothetical protein